MSQETNDAASTTRTDRRRFVKALGALGVAGLAGCGGDGDGTPTDTETSSDGTDDTDAGTETTTESPTPTEEPMEDLGTDPEPLLSLEGATAPANETTTLTGTLSHPYLFDLESVEVTAEAPNDDWTVTATGETSFETIGIGDTQEVGWEVSVPEGASGPYTLSFNVTYESATDQADVTVEQSVTVFTPGEPPEDGLIAHFPLEGSPPTNAAGDGEGTTTGDPVTDAEGVVGSAYEFDGEDDFVSLPEFGADVSSVSVSMWVNTENWGGPETQLLFWGGPVPDHTGFELWMPEGSGVPEFFYWDGEQVNLVAGGGSAPPSGEWVHLCAVYDDDAGTGTMYVNGESVGSQSVQFGPSLDPVDTMLAAHPDGEPAFRNFAGRIDEVRVYDRPLSQAEAASIAN